MEDTLGSFLFINILMFINYSCTADVRLQITTSLPDLLLGPWLVGRDRAGTCRDIPLLIAF
jgi:hypothetical protein